MMQATSACFAPPCPFTLTDNMPGTVSGQAEHVRKSLHPFSLMIVTRLGYGDVYSHFCTGPYCANDMYPHQDIKYRCYSVASAAGYLTLALLPN